MTAPLLRPLARLSRSLAFAIRLATARFPLAALLIIGFAVLSNVLIEDADFVDTDTAFRLFAALYGGAVVSVALRLVAESHRWPPLLRLLLPVAGAAAFAAAVWWTQTFWIVAPILTTAVTLAIPLAPYVGRPDEERFWAFTLWTLVGVTLAFLSVLLFTLGVSAILEMIRFLFDVGLGDKAYEHIYVTALTLVGPLFALGRIPADLDEVVVVDAGDRLALGIRFLFDWVAAPLALVTAAVLHLYAAKIVLFSQWPKNEVGWIVTFFAALVLAVRIAAEPFLLGGAATIRAFGRFWAPMLAVPIALLVYAASVRIHSEGFTLARYYLALGALASALVVAMQMVPRLRGDIRWMAGLPIILLALSSFGPWGVAATVGRSQAGFLAAALPSEGRAEAVAALNEEGRAGLRSRIDALDEVGQTARLLPLVPEKDRSRLAASSPALGLGNDFVAALGLANSGSQSYLVTMISTQDPPFDVSGFDLILMERYVYPKGGPVDPTSGTDALLALEGDNLAITYRGATDRVSLSRTFVGMSPDTVGGEATAPVIADLQSENGRRVRLRIRQASFDQTSKQPSYLGTSVLLKRGEWPAESPPPPSLGGGQGGAAQPSGAVGERPR